MLYDLAIPGDDFQLKLEGFSSGLTAHIQNANGTPIAYLICYYIDGNAILSLPKERTSTIAPGKYDLRVSSGNTTVAVGVIEFKSTYL